MFSEVGGSIRQELPKGTSWIKTDIHNIPGNAFVGGYEDKGKRDVYIGNRDNVILLIACNVNVKAN